MKLHVKHLVSISRLEEGVLGGVEVGGEEFGEGGGAAVEIRGDDAVADEAADGAGRVRIYGRCKRRGADKHRRKLRSRVMR